MSISSASHDKTRRPGYAPAANAGVGRRGLHTRDRILACAADVFETNGFHGTSLDTIAKAAKASRATVYQYFAGKEDIFGELSAAAERDVFAHGERLGGLGPTVAGVDELHRWLIDWADVYDAHAAVFAEFPGIGTAMGLSVIDTGAFAETYQQLVAERIQRAPLTGLDAQEAAAVLGRLPHMVNLYRHRAMFPLPDRATVTWSLTVAVQLMLFPDTPADVVHAAAPASETASAARVSVVVESAGPTTEPDSPELSPIAQDVLAVSSQLFAEHGYYAVSMEQIAAAAELGRATLYRYFGTKDRILAELTRRAVAEIEGQATTLPRVATTSLTEWMLGYVRFHRVYRGVIRAWFDGTVAEQLSDADVTHGITTIHRAVEGLMNTVELPAGIDGEVATAVFLAVLGRMTEPTSIDSPDDDRAADLMANLLRRSLLCHAPQR